MKPEDREAFDDHYAASRSWTEDRLDAARSSRRIAWIVAALAVGVAIFEAIALAMLAPLKSVVPYTILVDRQTGFVQELNALDPGRIKADTALTQSLLVQYVEARESFDTSQLASNYRKVGLWSAQSARSDYLALMRSDNPAGPLAQLSRTTIIETRVKSVSPIAPNVALVRFDTERRDNGGSPDDPQPWVAIIRYRFSNGPMSTADRFQNPLGFQVLRYRRDAEAVPPPSAASRSELRWDNGLRNRRQILLPVEANVQGSAQQKVQRQEQLLEVDPPQANRPSEPSRAGQ